MNVISAEEMAERLAALRQPTIEVPGDVAEVIAQVNEKYHYVRPFASAADSLIEYLQNQHGRFMTGLRELDVMMRGIGRGELAYVTGFAFSGKTQFFLNAVTHNIDRRVVLFTLDEPSELVLAKLVGLREGWNFEWVEQRIKAQDQKVIRRVRDIAAIDFQNLLVIDTAHTLVQASDAMKEAEDYFGERIDAVGVDYLELWEGDDVDSKSQALKRWTTEHEVPVLCIHQGGKGETGKGAPITMSSMRFGGHAEAIFIIGVRRKRDWEELDDFDRAQHINTVSISVVKNKRPPSKRGEHDYFLHPETGFIRGMEPGDPGTPLERAQRPDELPSLPISQVLLQRAAERAQREQVEGQGVEG